VHEDYDKRRSALFGERGDEVAGGEPAEQVAVIAGILGKRGKESKRKGFLEGMQRGRTNGEMRREIGRNFG
jgi:hypothetical protein